MDSKKHNRHLVYILYFVGFLDLFGVSLIIPLFSRRNRELGASPAVVGAIGSVYGGIQLFSSPLMGKASDVIGRRTALLISLAGAGIGYLLMGCVDSLALMVVCRVIVGTFKHSLSIIKTYLTDVVSSSSEHAAILGKMNAISNIGFIIGPPVGGLLAMQENGFFTVALFTGILFAVNFIFVLIFLKPNPSEKLHDNVKIADSSNKKSLSSPSSNTWNVQNVHNRNESGYNDDKIGTRTGERSSQENGPRTRRKELYTDNSQVCDKKEKTKKPKTPWLSSLSISSLKDVWDILLIRFVLGFGMLIYRSNFSTLLEFRYNSTPDVNGYLMSFNGIVGVICGFLSGKIISYFKSDSTTLYYFSVLLGLSLAGLTYAPTLWTVVAFQIPLSMSSSTMRVCATSITMQRGHKDEKGVIMGLGNSLLSLARMLSPALAGIALEFSIYGPGCLSVAATITGFILMTIFPQDKDIYIGKKEKVL